MAYDGPFEIDAGVHRVLDRGAAPYIDGEWSALGEADRLPILDPSTGAPIAAMADTSGDMVDRAVRSGRAAFADGRWRDLRPADRERVLLRLADLVEERAELFAQLETLEQGKSLAIARAVEVGGAIDWIRFVAGLATKVTGRTFDVSLPGGPSRWTSFTRREPVGLVAGIAPWNFPLLIAVWKVLPALAAGCSVVLKPSELTPLTALLLAEIASEAGVPPGVFNVVTGRGASTGRALVTHPDVAKVTFTGSTAAGRAVGHDAIEGMKRVTLELGGKAPAVVLRDADLAKVVPGLMAAGFLNGGQVCAAATRVYAEVGIYDDLVAALTAAVGAMRPGAGLDPAAQVNPLVSAAHQAKVQAFLDAAERGGEVRRGAEVPAEGFYVPASLILNPDPASPIAREEVFGPLLGITKVADADEAVRRANDTETGLSASVWTRDIDAAMALTRRIEAGTVWVNSHVFIDPAMPFGGTKLSGVGRDFGVDWLDAFTELKSVCIAH